MKTERLQSCVRLILRVFSQMMLSYTSLAEQIFSDFYSYQMMMMMMVIILKPFDIELHREQCLTIKARDQNCRVQRKDGRCFRDLSVLVQEYGLYLHSNVRVFKGTGEDSLRPSSRCDDQQIYWWTDIQLTELTQMHRSSSPTLILLQRSQSSIKLKSVTFYLSSILLFNKKNIQTFLYCF